MLYGIIWYCRASYGSIVEYHMVMWSIILYRRVSFGIVEYHMGMPCSVVVSIPSVCVDLPVCLSTCVLVRIGVEGGHVRES